MHQVIEERCLSNQNCQRTVMFSTLSRNSWCCFYSFWNSIVTRVCQHISVAPGKSLTTLQHHNQISTCLAKKMRGTTVVDETLLLLWSCSCLQESGATYLTIYVRKQMDFFSFFSCSREFLDVWSSSSYFPGSAVTQTLRSLTVYQGQHYFW